MRRTQIYLDEEEAARLDDEARRTGHTRSQLIREAIASRYQTVRAPEAFERALRASSGVWRSRRLGGEQYVERKRRGRLAKLYQD